MTDRDIDSNLGATPTSTPDLQLDCQTCLASNTTACSECIVTHVLANDDGPISLVSTGLTITPASSADPAVEAAVGLLAKAGLLDADPVWVDRAEFDTARSAEFAPLG